ncbi:MULTISPECIES: hypothetical protein [Streptomyces]|uniref:Uncharacterized protein n=1 Tax=Streptomyces doudnae TaxID=3075536 RepID=A0ABD5EM68_9ACTN|nr:MULTISPECIES: hypothetical protein [unclassified Streptomyces]MDT0435666.1 hypothetical protein [Streptomyces sp. DSM 41981]MYQ62620.1 hypothetical protein [Streptomyces sp. SID4950]SCD40921.1 hypothetical protein GA0115242_1048126 [Streptomyces sp. SolWspMP-5a-2]
MNGLFIFVGALIGWAALATVAIALLVTAGALALFFAARAARAARRRMPQTLPRPRPDHSRT